VGGIASMLRAAQIAVITLIVAVAAELFLMMNKIGATIALIVISKLGFNSENN
jgi:hypothetical protein